MTKKPQQISSYEPNKEIEGFYLATEKNIRKTRAGDSYIDLTLQDKTGKISAKIWNDVEEQNDEFASPRRPLTKEAILLHFLDEMDAKLNIFDKAIEEEQNEGKWTSANNYFGAQLYKGSREDE